MDDGEAVNLMRQGDRRGPEALLNKYQMSIYNLTLRILGSPADAEDATQEVFLRAFQRNYQYRPGEPFGGWLHGIAKHYCIDLLRRRPQTGALADPTVSTPDVESLALAAIDRSQVRAALEQLSGRDRALLVLRYWEDQPVEAIARTMRISEGATKVALLRARRALAARLPFMEAKAHAL